MCVCVCVCEEMYCECGNEGEDLSRCVHAKGHVPVFRLDGEDERPPKDLRLSAIADFVVAGYELLQDCAESAVQFHLH